MGEMVKRPRWRLRWGKRYLKSYWISRGTPYRRLTQNGTSSPCEAMRFSSRLAAEKVAKKVNFYLDQGHQWTPIEV